VRGKCGARFRGKNVDGPARPDDVGACRLRLAFGPGSTRESVRAVLHLPSVPSPLHSGRQIPLPPLVTFFLLPRNQPGRANPTPAGKEPVNAPVLGRTRRAPKSIASHFVPSTCSRASLTGFDRPPQALQPPPLRPDRSPRLLPTWIPRSRHLERTSAHQGTGSRTERHRKADRPSQPRFAAVYRERGRKRTQE